MILFYSICMILAILMYVWMYVTDRKRSLNQHLLILCVVLCNSGFTALAVSGNMTKSLFPYVVICVGACFEPVLYYFTMCEMCHVTLQKRFKIVLILSQAVIFTLCFWYSAFAIIAYMTWIIYLLLTLILGGVSLKRNKISVRQYRDIWVNFVVAFIVFLVIHILTNEVYSVALMQIFFIIGMMNAVYSSNLFTLKENQEVISEEMEKIGLIAFDSKMRYMGCNNYAKAIFESISKCTLGASIDEATLNDFSDAEHAPFNEILSDVGKFAGYSKEQRANIGNSKYLTIKVKDRSFDCEINQILNFMGNCKGFSVNLKDETEHYLMLEISERYNEKLESDVEKKTQQIRTMQEKIILGMAQLVESRDLSTGGHIRRTSDVVRIFADKLLEADMGFTKSFLNLVIRSAPMHDLGKIGVEDAVLQKQAKFLPDEYEKMKKHAENGGRILRDVLKDVEDEDFIEVVSNVAHYHHERVDGKGYPEGLKGDDIPVEARIMALADVFDALVSKRCYKEAFSYDEAFRIITEESGTHFDEKLVAVFLKCRPELEEYYNNNN